MKALILAMSLLAITTPAKAREISVPEVPQLRLDLRFEQLTLPKYTECVHESERMACYSLHDQVQVLKVEAYAQSLFTRNALLEAAYEAQAHQLVLLDGQLSLAENNDALGRAHSERLTQELMDTIKKKNDWRAKAEEPVVWPYIVGGGALLLGLGVGAGAFLAN